MCLEHFYWPTLEQNLTQSLSYKKKCWLAHVIDWVLYRKGKKNGCVEDDGGGSLAVLPSIT